jgi:Histidine kinase-, DNA gyrase B-, and HSP90-like ATPase
LEKFTLKSGQNVAFKRHGTVLIRVTDTGVGMSEKQLESLFQDGTQFNVNELQSGHGSGLGLFISKGMVAQHGGELRASSPGLGHGATFTLSLPLYQIPDGDGNLADDLKKNVASSSRPLASTRQLESPIPRASSTSQLDDLLVSRIVS